MLGKIEYKPNADVAITGDVYLARSNILEPTMVHVEGNTGNRDDWQMADYSKVTTAGGYVTGATVNNVQMDNLNARWKQDMTNFATGLNGKFKVEGWQLEGNLARSTASRDTIWSAVQMTMLQPGAVTWNFPRDEWMTYSFSKDTGNPANFSTNVGEQWGPTYAGKLRDSLNSQQLNASQPVNWGDITKLKFGLRATQREKSYSQTSWNYASAATIPTLAFQRVTVDGRPDFIELADGFGNAVTKYFGAAALSTDGRTPTTSDLVQNNWRAKESNTALYTQADLSGTTFGGLSYRGNVGVRVAHSSQTGSGNEQINGGAVTPVSTGAGYTRLLPSLNLILNLDPEDAFYKKISDYIGISSVAGTFNGKAASYTSQVNRDGGHVQGLEFIYQQAFTSLPAPWNGLGMAANYTYTDSNIKEHGDRSGASFKPIDTNDLM